MNGFDRYLQLQYNQSGGFMTSLFDAISRADEINLMKLERGFPSEVKAYLTWTREGLHKFVLGVSPDNPLLERFLAEYNLEVKTV